MKFARWQWMLLVLLGIGAIWALLALEIARMQEDELRVAQWNIRFQAQAVAENSRTAVERVNELLLSLRDEWEGNAETFKDLVEARQAYMSDIAFQVAVIDARGYLAYSNLQSRPTPTYLGDRAHFRVHLDRGGDQLFISEPVFGAVSQRWTIQFTRPIYRRHQFAGVLVISVTPEVFAEAHLPLVPQPGSQILVARADGTLLAGSAGQGDAAADPHRVVRLHEPPFDSLNPPMAGALRLPASAGQPARLRGYARLPQYDLMVVVSEPLDASMRNFGRQRNAVVAGAAVFSLLLLLSAALLLRSRAATLAARNAVMHSKAILASAVDALGQGFVVYDLDHQLVYCNERYREFYPQSREAIRPGVRFDDLLRYGLARGEYPEALGREDQWLAERLQRHLVGNSDSIQQIGNGRWLRVLERRTTEGYTVGLRLDITELIEARQAAERSLQQVREANQGKSVFLSNISHELRTPLSGVLGFAGLLARSELTPHQRAQLDMLQDSAEQLHVLVSNLLDVTALEGGRLALHETPFSPTTLLQDSLRSAALHQRNPVALASRSPTPLPDLLVGDHGRIRQVLMQLLDNARKFTSSGEIVLSARWEADDAADPHAGRLILQVTDTGSGMPADVQADLLALPADPAPFPARAEAGNGLGLGLSLAHAIVTRMRGEFDVRSTPGTGTTVVVSLPLRSCADAAGAQATPAP